MSRLQAPDLVTPEWLTLGNPIADLTDPSLAAVPDGCRSGPSASDPEEYLWLANPS